VLSSLKGATCNVHLSLVGNRKHQPCILCEPFIALRNPVRYKSYRAGDEGWSVGDEVRFLFTGKEAVVP
jgi:hypothetical protein